MNLQDGPRAVKLHTPTAAFAGFSPLSAWPLPPSTLRLLDDEAFTKLAQATPQRLSNDIGLDISLDFNSLRLVDRLGAHDRLSRCRITG